MKNFRQSPIFAFLAIHLILVSLISLILALYLGDRPAAAYFLGGLVILLNSAALAFGWKLILDKKFVALAALSIVFKYAILGVIIYKAIWVNGLSPLYFVLGIFTLSLSALILALFGRNFGI